ncbi:MAG TPA: ABC transporter ATP-binding protein [Tepidisphaeraceae bacterium]|nr:ABC transporter ATP-binding protein [Tepidisphaeraceae bacterium]
MTTTTRPADKPADKPRGVADAVIVARGVFKTFRMGDSVIHVLKDAGVVVRGGEFIAIEGRSGSGKSTLLHILGGLDAADSGTVEFESEDIGELSRRAAMERQKARPSRVLRLLGPLLAMAQTAAFAARLFFGGGADRRLAHLRNTRFGFVFQFYHLLPELNVLENTMLGAMIENSWFAFKRKRAGLRTKATAILEELGMGHRLTHRPSQLSGGERQRVAIARALMNDPKVLFADEPTGNLDAETGQQIMGVFERLHRERGQTIVMVTHDRALARRADRILVLKDGKLEAPADADAA